MVKTSDKPWYKRMPSRRLALAAIAAPLLSLAIAYLLFPLADTAQPPPTYTQHIHTWHKPAYEASPEVQLAIELLLKECATAERSLGEVEFDFTVRPPRVVRILFDGKTPSVPPSLLPCLEERILAHLWGDAYGRYEHPFDYPGGERFPYPIPEPSMPVITLGHCSRETMRRWEHYFWRRGLEVRHMYFLDGEALVTLPRHVDAEGEEIAGSKDAPPKSSCWDLHGLLRGLGACILGTPERIRVRAALCTSAEHLATLAEKPAHDPAIQMDNLAKSGRPLPLDSVNYTEDMNIHLASYLFTRGSGDSKFTIEKNRVDPLLEVPGLPWFLLFQ